jgi:TolB-like protein/class 3 adenylate cyclase/cytochrome c-type biogenesis protein CcmH/NrfG
MTNERVQRRLAAILAADVVGYSRLMERDEKRTLAALKERRKTILGPLVAQHQGRIVKVMGDGVLVEFASAVNAVECAIALQARMAAANEDERDEQRIVLRIGINLGDVIVEGSDLYGDGVNVAARLESFAVPGEICVSASVHEQVKRKLDVRFDDLGLQAIKNIAEPVQLYHIGAPRQQSAETDGHALPLPSLPSIAVLPFTNMSNDPDQEVFVDGLTEDLITDLSRTTGLFVIARNSTFAYKGKSVDARTIARDLGVRYLLEGSARRAATRVRINAQLIDSVGGGHLWAERFDRSLDDMFAVQDEVVGKIVDALVGRFAPAPPRKRPASMAAYDLTVRARMLVAQSPHAAQEARLLLQQAIALDPGYAEAHRWLAFYFWEAWTTWAEPLEPNRANAVAAAEAAVALDPHDAGNRYVLGHLRAYQGRWGESDTEFAAALKVDPNYADAWAFLSDVSVLRGRPKDAIEQIQKALRLNPHPPGRYYWLLGAAQYASHQYDGAAATLRRESTYRSGSRRTLAAALARLGRLDEARQEAKLFMASNPNFTISAWVASHPFPDDATRQHFVDGYKMAGLPD